MTGPETGPETDKPPGAAAPAPKTPGSKRTPEQWARHRARQARRERRFDRPILRLKQRLRAWASMFFVDHGFFRYLNLNQHRVGARAWRSAQPAPHHFRRFARQGIRTVIYLRAGTALGSWQLEKDACAASGLELRRFGLRSRRLPEAKTIRAFKALLEEVEYPVLFHCKSGADRAGLAAALYLLLAEGRPVAEAKRQLSFRYLHLRQGKTGVLDAMLEAYEADAAARPIGFLDWVDTRYDPAAIEAGFRPTRLGDLLTDRLFRRE